MTNKTSLIVGGVAVASAAAGVAGGYLFAKKQFEARLTEEIEREVSATKKFYEARLEELSAEPEIESDEPELELEAQDYEITDDTRNVIVENGRKALTNYQGFAVNDEIAKPKPPLAEVASNIFTNAAQKKQLPPRDERGLFLPRTQAVPEDRFPEPYEISPEEFLANDPEHDQESLLYFVRDETAIMVADNEVVADDRIGVNLLQQFSENENLEVIYVRNPTLDIDYQVTRTNESLTVYMGLGEDEADYVGLSEDDADMPDHEGEDALENI